MNFQEVLQSLVERVDGCTAGIIMGFDGVAVEEYRTEGSDVDLTTLGVEYCTAFGEVRRTADSLHAGSVMEVSVQTSNSLVLMRPINEEYFLAVVLSPDGNFGKGRYYLRRAVRSLAPEF